MQKPNGGTIVAASMIPNDKTGPVSPGVAAFDECRTELIRNGTCQLKIPPNGCRFSSKQRAPSERHTLSIPAVGGGSGAGTHRLLLPIVAAAAAVAHVNECAQLTAATTNVPGIQAEAKLVVANQKKRRETKFYSGRRPPVIRFAGAAGAAGAAASICLAATLLICLLHVPLEAECKSVENLQPETGVLLEGNSLLNNQIDYHKSLSTKNSTQAPSSSPSQIQSEQEQNQDGKHTTVADKIISIFRKTTTPTTSAIKEEEDTEEAKEETKGEEEGEVEAKEENGSSTGRDDDDAESCKGISADGSPKTKNLTDSERLVNLQSCFQRKIRNHLKSSTRSGMEMFEQLSLSGGCSSSLMNLMGGLSDLKSYAFKFLDASAKIPSGMMYGLLSDYGDFDQCLSIRSNKGVELEQEAEEGAFSGKYCLMSLKLNYHVKLEENTTVPEGIIEDGILWDELVRHYWTSKISKGFQVGMCFPSRCTNDDLNQLYQHTVNKYNVIGEIISCQDSLDLKRQYQPDLMQRTVIQIFYALLGLTFIGTLVDRCCWQVADMKLVESCGAPIRRVAGILLCFSIARNWSKFMQGYQNQRQQPQKNSRFWSQVNQNNLTKMKRNNETTPSSMGTRPITEQTSIETNNRISTTTTTTASNDNVEFIDSDPESSSAATIDDQNRRAHVLGINISNKLAQPLTVHIDSAPTYCGPADMMGYGPTDDQTLNSPNNPLAHLSGLKLFIIIWITVGYSFLYPSANNYQYYRSIIKMNFTRDSVWFATTNFTLGIDMLLYITGLLFAYRLLLGRRSVQQQPAGRVNTNRDDGVLSLISKKAIRFWPTYLTVIGFAIVVPLIGDGPMWPEMVTKRVGESCRRSWWANLLFINNYLGQSDICLPSSWFISILMQLFFVGSIIIVLVRKVSLEAGLAILTTLLISSSVFSFCFAYFLRLRAPVIIMDESFVMDLDENIFSLYTNIFNNLGPFLVGMAGGILLIRSQSSSSVLSSSSRQSNTFKSPQKPTPSLTSKTYLGISGGCLALVGEILVAIAVVMIALLVLSSVFHENYSRITSATYWSLHRIGWAIVTGYIVHNCATGKWKLLNDLLSLSAFAPLSRLIFIAYLVYPVFIHIHTGLVRDGLHVSIYNMLNIYITRLVMTFATALIIHLLVELPFSTIEENYLRRWISNKIRARQLNSAPEKTQIKQNPSRTYPLLAVATTGEIIDDRANMDENKSRNITSAGILANKSSDELIPASERTQLDE